MLVVKVSPGCYVMWFREEIVQQVHWGADDNKEGTPSECARGWGSEGLERARGGVWVRGG